MSKIQTTLKCKILIKFNYYTYFSNLLKHRFTMKTSLNCIIVSLICLTKLHVVASNDYNRNQTTNSITFHVNTNGYYGFLMFEGKDYSDSSKSEHTFTFTPVPGSYSCSIETGATYADVTNSTQSNIAIFFSLNGQIDYVLPDASATISSDKHSITFNTTKISINPRRFNLAWSATFLSRNNYKIAYLHNKEKIVLINGLSYQIIGGVDANLFIGANSSSLQTYTHSFTFSLDATGNVYLFNTGLISAAGDGHKLKFKTYKMVIDPQEISGDIPVCFNDGYEPIEINKRKKYWVIRGTVNYVKWTAAPDTEKIYYFIQL